MRVRTVTVDPPLNIADHHRHLYDNSLSYPVFPAKTRMIRNAFVSFTGFCMDKNGLIKECHHDYPEQMDYYLNEASTYYYDVTDNPDHLIYLDDNNTYLAIHHPFFNYYHWICEGIFRIWTVRKRLDNLVLLLPEFYKDADFITGSLEPFNIKNIFYMPQGKSVMVRRLCLPRIKPICDSYHPTHLQKVRAFYRNYVSDKLIKAPRIERLYISRDLAPRRKVINESEIAYVLKKCGFEIFYPERYSFLEQVAIFSQVRYLVGTHGSGLTNMLFMNSSANLLELHKSRTHHLDHPSPLFWYMAKSLGINYYHQICDTPGQENYFHGDYFVDPTLLEKNLRLMINC